MSSFEDNKNSSGLAGKIRASIDSDQFDLSGYNEKRVKELISNAFSQPFTKGEKMIKFTFIVGGGKQVRSKYDDNLPKWVTASLKETGFVEDKSAAETFDSQGTFKFQHDTGQNLKFITIFPFINDQSLIGENLDENGPTLLEENDPRYLVLASNFQTFTQMVIDKVYSYSQKKKLLSFLQENFNSFSMIEQKLVKGEILSQFETQIYEMNSGDEEKKIKWLQESIKAQIDDGKISEKEKSLIISNINKKIEEIGAEVANSAGKSSTLLEEKRNKMSKRLEQIKAITPIKIRLRYSQEIQTLRQKLFPLNELEEKARSMSLTLDDLKRLEKKSDLENEIREYENQSRSWFEDEEDFLSKCKFEEEESIKNYKKSKSTKGKSMGKSSSSSASKNSNSWNKVNNSKSKNLPKNSVSNPSTHKSRFAAAFSESDSD